MSIHDLQHAIARHIRDALPGREVEDYLRAARAVSNLWHGDEYKVGYRAGKAVGLAESSNGAEVAVLRDRIKHFEKRSTSIAPEVAEAAGRVRAYLAEMNRVDGHRPQYADDVHGINDHYLSRSDLKTILAALEEFA